MSGAIAMLAVAVAWLAVAVFTGLVRIAQAIEKVGGGV